MGHIQVDRPGQRMAGMDCWSKKKYPLSDHGLRRGDTGKGLVPHGRALPQDTLEPMQEFEDKQNRWQVGRPILLCLEAS